MGEPSTTSGGVELGYAEDSPAWKLHRRYFPSKIGGFPAWLDLHSLPLPSDLQCGSCSQPMSYLLQVYAAHDGDPAGFHRTTFVFVCRKSACMKPGNSPAVRVMRCCLPRNNSFYSSEPPAYDEKLGDPVISHPLCAVCGCLGPNTCSSCKKSFYCSRAHQMLAWKSGHKEECAGIKDDEAVLKGKNMETAAIFSEYELVVEPEELEGKKEEKTEDEKMLEYQKLLMNNAPTLNDTSADELDPFYASAAKDKTFRAFQKRVKQNPEQVLRYDRGGVPLLLSDKHVPGKGVKNVSRCSCGAPRTFEYQIMPQILNYLDQEESLTEGLDFGTILVYTCSRNCHSESIKYQPEFAWVQPVQSEGRGPRVEAAMEED
ncbi:hypothetical protein RvY_16523 [Ramazzottius varieornatus]|uniref:MYND-type domain-containing protein n=1 Tax=Ramazzottius varieornatus TaxID=947166 RepID=A0A1D1VYS3_RAMVA|nr:hypothetical protein RvY_16523 [Ramazzottius varieornatus]